MTQPAPAAAEHPAAPSERGWGKLLLAFAAFLIVPAQLRALMPVDSAVMLFVPALAACALVGWWAGGRVLLAVVWVALSVWIVAFPMTPSTAFDNLVRGWSLLLAGAFGLVCLLGDQRPLLARALLALCITFVLAAVMSLIGPVTLSQASSTVAAEFARRNADTMAALNTMIQSHAQQWNDLTKKVPLLADLPSKTQDELTTLSNAGRAIFPALLALESLAALALAWATYHRLSRTRLGAPLRPLRDFRFNDQLVWGLIVGLTIILVPTLTTLRGTGKNLLVFFGALYAVRGFGVLTWFMAPGSLGITVAVGFLMLFAPVLNEFAVLAFLMLGIAALALGLGDTWADWRHRARPTS